MLVSMPVCPFCQADIAMPNLPCAGCGKLMRDHPSLSAGKHSSVQPAARGSGQVVAVRALPSDGEGPELDLSSRHAPKPVVKAPSLPPASVPRKPSAPRTLGSSAAAPAKPVQAPGVGGAVFDEDDIFSPGGGAGEAIELEMPLGGPGAGLSGAPAVKTLAPAPQASMVPLARGPLGNAHDPSDEESEARALADYGDSPDSFWQAPLYAYRVKTRQSELRRQLGERKADLARAKKSEEQAQVAFAERARPIATRLEGYSQVLAPIASAENVMMQRDGALSADLDSHKGRLAVIDERVHGFSVELDTAKAEERDIEAKLTEADAIRQRAEAKLKRAEIEIRSATAVAESGGVKVGPARRAGSPS